MDSLGWRSSSVRSRGGRSLVTQRANFKRWAPKLLRLDWVEHRSEGLLGDLLDCPYESWLKVIDRADDRLQGTD